MPFIMTSNGSFLPPASCSARTGWPTPPGAPKATAHLLRTNSFGLSFCSSALPLTYNDVISSFYRFVFSRRKSLPDVSLLRSEILCVIAFFFFSFTLFHFPFSCLFFSRIFCNTATEEACVVYIHLVSKRPRRPRIVPPGQHMVLTSRISRPIKRRT